MRVRLSWLSDPVDVDVPVATLADTLTFAGIEIETIHRVGDDLAALLPPRAPAVTQHPPPAPPRRPTGPGPDRDRRRGPLGGLRRPQLRPRRRRALGRPRGQAPRRGGD